LEKANIKRSGCLAAGVNALNAYIGPGKTPEDYAEYAMRDAKGIARRDLLVSMSRRLNRAASEMEKLGLTILKEDGNVAMRGDRNVKINGENIKPLLAAGVLREKRIQVLNRVNVYDLIVKDGTVVGALGAGVFEDELYVFHAKAVLVATGGAAGLYKPNHPGDSRHKMWYPPFNTGSGYAMGIRAGAEMTSFEMRFVALRCKDTIAPTGTLAQGVGARQVNVLGEDYSRKYGVATSDRVFGTVEENRLGRGPCYLKTEGISKEQDRDLMAAYLNMAPSQTLRWLETVPPSMRNVEIEGTEPYITGGHTASGYWIDEGRGTTLPGLYAAGDVAGGCPQKYVTGAFAEGEIAAESAVAYVEGVSLELGEDANFRVQRHLRGEGLENPEDLEKEMQEAMDQYAGGISQGYRYTGESLAIADGKIKELAERAEKLRAKSPQELLQVLELEDKLLVCESVIAHLDFRKETRWRTFAEREDCPGTRDEYEGFANSRRNGNKIEVFLRKLEVPYVC
jgi:adenylylsulfate reductase subunit A